MAAESEEVGNPEEKLADVWLLVSAGQRMQP